MSRVKDQKQYQARLNAVMAAEPKWGETRAKAALKKWKQGAKNKNAKIVHDIIVANGLL
jgi:hypothetical protein